MSNSFKKIQTFTVKMYLFNSTYTCNLTIYEKIIFKPIFIYFVSIEI